LLGKEVTPEVNGLEIAADLGGRRFQAAELSPGEGVLLTWAILLHQQAPSLQDAVVLIDEPEAHLHPSVQQHILSSIRAVLGDRGQLWAVTHSPDVAERPDVTNLILVEQRAIRPLAHRPSTADEPELGLVVSKPSIRLPSLRPAKAALGESDFSKIITNSSIYVDKTQFIEDVLGDPATVLLFPRPRRFGKSLNLSTLRFFVEKSPESQQRKAWFEDLRVWKSDEALRHFGRYPVIYLNLKEAKGDSFSDLFEAVRNTIADLYEEHRHLLDERSLSASEQITYERILRAEAEPKEYWLALKRLSHHLERYHKERVMILVDEYDAPLHEAYFHGYLDKATGFFGKFFSAGLKDNPHLFKGVLTGVLRIARESLFSELNNLSVYSILRPEFSTHFGFTEDEVEDLCWRLGAPELMSGLREWYNGYLFGDQVVFNPWSVLSCLSSKDKRLDPYWVGTGSSKLLRKQLFEKGRGLGGELSALLRGESIDKPVDEKFVLRDLDATPDAVWSLALFSGYLKPAEPWRGADQRSASLTIPNLEVRREIEGFVREYFSKLVGGTSNVEHMIHALLHGDDEEVQTYLNHILTHTMSFHELNRRTLEVTYHVMMVSLTAIVEPSYEVRSNSPSGLGRYDLMMIPKVEGKPGVCLEFKRLKGKNVDRQLDQALRQMDALHYTAELERRGAHPIHKMAIVFEGRRAWVKRAKETAQGVATERAPRGLGGRPARSKGSRAPRRRGRR
jgi:hypothetical protein